MPLTAAQRQAGDADLARRRATRAAIYQGNERVLQVNDLLDALETLADALVCERRSRDEARAERDALQSEMAAHRCRLGLAEE